MANGFRRFLINFRELFTREEDLYQAEKIVKRLYRKNGSRDLKRATFYLRRFHRRLILRFTLVSSLILIAVLVLAGMLISHALGKSAGNGQQAGSSGGLTAVPAVSETESAEEEPAAEETEDMTVREVLLSFTGDCTLGTDENFDQSRSFNAYYSENGGAYFLERVRDVFAGDDLTIINMEGTFTTSEDRADKTYAFKGDPSYVNVLTTASVEAANLANNHSSDYGKQSYDDTIQVLESNGITTFGYDEVKVIGAGGVKVGLMGIYELRDHLGRTEQVKENIAKLKEQGAEVIVAVFHWGTEKETEPDENQVTLAHLAIDEGADIVVGHHPHVLQGLETYKGKTIAYSLGNFCFGGNSNPSDKDTMILQAKFTLTGRKVTEREITVIPCSLSSARDYNNYQPVILAGDEASRVRNKVNSLSQGLDVHPQAD